MPLVQVLVYWYGLSHTSMDYVMMKTMSLHGLSHTSNLSLLVFDSVPKFLFQKLRSNHFSAPHTKI